MGKGEKKKKRLEAAFEPNLDTAAETGMTGKQKNNKKKKNQKKKKQKKKHGTARDQWLERNGTDTLWAEFRWRSREKKWR